jgi:TDG/mug DNA glycosylase family protein
MTTRGGLRSIRDRTTGMGATLARQLARLNLPPPSHSRDDCSMLPDYLEDNLAVVFVGTSVATASARRGHYYGGPGNKFWELLWEAGLTGERILSPEQDAWVLRYGIGLTDVVKSLAASSDSLLKSTDYDVPASL